MPVLVLLSVAIIIIGKADERLLDSARMAATDAVAPVLDAIARPLNAADNMIEGVRDTVALFHQNTRLESENERLLQWQDVAHRLAAENQQLRGLLNLVPEPGASYVTARVIANSGGAYVRTLMINAGSDDGLARGQAAITGDGLVGRLTEVGGRAARVLLITDLNSRIPVAVDGTPEKAVLAGDNSERPRLLYLPQNGALKVGDRIVTSGEGGLFPPGLPIGVVASLDGGVPRIEPYVELSQVGYLRIVNYGLADALPHPVALAPRGRRALPGTPDDAATR
jgi:rod shape-determining protein MreC